MHNKFCLFDGHLLITGSYNWTYSAERRNAENIITTDEINVCSDYANHYAELWNGLSEVTEYSHISLSSVDVGGFLQEYDTLVEEYTSMGDYNVITPEVLEDVHELRDSILVTKTPVVVMRTTRVNPILKLNIGMKCRIDGVDNRTLNIIKQGQELPCTNTVGTVTADDYQESIVCDILFGNSDSADMNKSLVKIQMNDLPKLKAGQVGFKTKVTIDANANMCVEYICTNTGLAKEAKCTFPDLLSAT